jgi:hypothetical protein
MPKMICLAILALFLTLSTALADQGQQAPGKTALVIDAFPLQGPLAGLEPEVLDFRYQPGRGQACLGLPDDPYKTIVGSDGGLYYDYGKRGPGPYDNGQGSFGTRVLADLQAEGAPGPRQQSLYSPRIPIVVTQREHGDWLVRQEAWSGVLQGETLEARTPQRVDYLWLTLTNRSRESRTGTVALNAGTTSALNLDATRKQVLRHGPGENIFCQFSRACQPPAGNGDRHDAAGPMRVEARSGVSVTRNWARPQVECASCFRHVLVGFGQPLEFRFAASAHQKFRVAVGLIEGWHAEPGKRPVQVQVEGQPARTVDLVQELGQNVPRVLQFPAADIDGDGQVAVTVHPVAGAEDRNTILSGLWIFPADAAPTDAEIVSGKADARALARVDADHMPRVPQPLRLTWDTGAVAAGQSFELLVAVPLGEAVQRGLTLPEPAAARRQAVEFWNGADLPFDRFTVPDPAVQALLDSCIRNIYQAREIKDGRPAFQVGPTCYRGTWAADGPFILEAITYLGRADEVRAGLEQQVDADSGPGGVEFSKKSGLRLWMIRRHAQLTGDREWLKRMWPRVERDVNQIVEYRKMTRDDPQQANFGLMPIGFGDGGLGGKHREYTNVYWTLAGLKAAIEMAQELNEPAAAGWQAEYADYWQVFDKARNRDKQTDADGNTYVPVTMQGEQPQLPQRGAWAFLQSIFPGRVFPSDDPLMLGTLAMLDASQREGLIYGTGWIEDGIWNYAASFYAHAHLWLGHGRKAAATLYAFGNHALPLLTWREEQNPVGERPHYVGDMPHNWGSAEFIRLVRHLLILERGRELHLFEGLPRAWTQPGCMTELKAVPTAFGDVSLKLEVGSDGRSATIRVDPPNRTPAERIVVHLEHFARPTAKVSVNGKHDAVGPLAIPTDRASTLQIELAPPAS